MEVVEGGAEEVEGEGDAVFGEQEGPQGNEFEEQMVPRAFADGEGMLQEEITNAILERYEAENDDLTEYQAKTPLVSKASTLRMMYDQNRSDLALKSLLEKRRLAIDQNLTVPADSPDVQLALAEVSDKC